MKKKILVTGLLIVSLGASLAFAAETSQEQQKTTPMGHMMNWEQMQDYHKQMIDQAVKDGRMTTEQAKAMDDRMNSMQDMMKNMGSSMMGQGMMGAGGNAGCPGAQAQPNISRQ